MNRPWSIVLLTLGVVFIAAVVVSWVRFVQTAGAPNVRGRVGVQLSGGDMLIRVQKCAADQAVERVQLVDSDGSVLWEIDALRPTSLNSFTVGSPPSEAFRETSALTEGIDLDSRVTIRVWLSESEGLVVNHFVPNSLDDELWDVTGSTSAGDRLTDVQLQSLDAC